ADTEGGRIVVDSAQTTSREKIFACGDVATGPVGTVVDAIATGKRAALNIHALLSGETRTDDASAPVPYSSLNLHYFQHESRPELDHLPYTEAIQSFAEVNSGLSPAAAVQEALRCFSCGTCIECDICLIFCPDVAIHRSVDGSPYEINYEFCKGCGVCVEECPRDAMSFEEELSCTN
ncbi:MAG: glutamate synthase, partial [FCB group bacterium]|nr:glutamate synthase [FCB group bacterium]